MAETSAAAVPAVTPLPPAPRPARLPSQAREPAAIASRPVVIDEEKASANSVDPPRAPESTAASASSSAPVADVSIAATAAAPQALPPTSARRRSRPPTAAAGARPPLLAAGDEPPPLYRTQLPPSVTLHYQVRRGSPARQREDPLGGRGRSLSPRPRSARRRAHAADADERRRHRRPRSGAGALPRPAGAPIGPGGELSPRRRPRHVLGNRRRVAAPCRQPGPPQLDDPARRHRRRGAASDSSTAAAITMVVVGARGDAGVWAFRYAGRETIETVRRTGARSQAGPRRRARPTTPLPRSGSTPSARTCRRAPRCATTPAPWSTTSCSSASSPTEPAHGRTGLHSAPRAARGAKERFAMHMLYNSDSFTVVAFDLPRRARGGRGRSAEARARRLRDRRQVRTKGHLHPGRDGGELPGRRRGADGDASRAKKTSTSSSAASPR